MVDAIRRSGTGTTDDSGPPPVHAFLIADIRGFTRFTQQQGDEAAARLVERFEALSRDTIGSHDGSVIEVRGDEILAVFRSPRMAITAAVALQVRLLEDSRTHPEAPLPVGIGLDAGEAVPVGDGYRGGALNLAARLCSQAEAGEILGSRELVHLSRKVPGVTFVDRGDLPVKGVSEPLGAHAIVPEGIDPAAEMAAFAPGAATTRDRHGQRRFKILGPIEVDAGSGGVPLGGPKQRTVLASLILRANEIVPVDVLTEEVWGEDPPATARNTIQTYVSQLRKAIGPHRIQAQPPGYRLQLDASELDAARFERLLADARRTRPTAPSTSAAMLEEALGLWRGTALSGIADGSLVSEIARLTELRATAFEDFVDDLLAIGEHARVIGQLEVFLGDEPLRERAWGQLMLALYRDGRQADALAAYQRARGTLADELGIDPSPELVRLHERILRQDPDLEARGEPLRGYRLLEKIGEGSVGSVFRAIQPHVGRDVVVKVINETIASGSSFVRRFEQEAHAVLALEHPYLVPVYDAWREPTGAYVVTRFLRGGSLQALMTQGSIPPERAGGIVEQVASALAFAHRSGVAHGSVGASNVLLDQEGNAFLGDFRVGVGAPPDQVEDRRRLLSLASDVLRGHPTGLDALLERSELLGEPPAAEEVAAAARLADGVVVTAGTIGVERNPFKGLRAFTEADAADFFGRKGLIENALRRLEEPSPGGRFLALVGPSGSGKSSLVRAGVVPAIRNGALRGVTDVLIAEMFPGRHPTDELESALLRIAVGPSVRLRDRLESGPRGLIEAVDAAVPGTTEVVLVVDQLEEVFTLTEDERERERFLESLRVAALDPESRLRVVVTLRADFYDRPLVYGRFGELLAARTAPVTALTPDELEQAIRSPAEAVGLQPEPGLVAEMIAAAADQPGALPLVQYALTELVDRRSEGRLSLGAYREIGGVAGALSVRADQLFDGADAGGRRAVTQLFLRLVTLGEGREDTRRRVPRRELDALDLDGDMLAGAIDAYGRHRFLTFDREPATREPTVEIAHEALLTAWGRLRRWIDEARQDLRQERALAAASAEWRAADRDPGFLLHGSRLDQFEAWSEGTQLSLAAGERELLRASAERRDEERAQELERRSKEERLERRSIRRLRAIVALAVTSALVAFTLTAVAVNQRDRAETEARISNARELAAASVANLRVDPELSILLAMESVELTRSIDDSAIPQSEDALHQAIGANRLELTIPGVGGSVAWSPTGVFAAGSAREQGVVEIVDGQTGRSLRSLDAHEGSVTGLAFNGDGTLLATTGTDGGLKLWDPSTGDLRSAIGDDGVAVSPVFSPDGSRVAAGWDRDRPVARIARVTTGQVLRVTRLPRGDLAISPDLSRVAVLSDTQGVMVDLATADRTRFAPEGIISAAWSPDGRYLATGYWSWVDVTDRSGRFIQRLQLFENVNGLSWSDSVGTSPLSGEGNLLVAGGTGSAKIWWVEDGSAQELMTIQPRLSNSVDGVAFSPDGSKVLTTNGEATAVKVWDVSDFGDAEVANLPAAYWYSDVEFSPDGRLARFEHNVVIQNPKAERSEVRFGPIFEELFDLGRHPQLEVSPDGRSIAVFGAWASVWDLSTKREIFRVPPNELITEVNWNPDGDRLVMASLHGWIKIMDRTGRTIRVIPGPDGYEITSARFSPDGRSIAMAAVPAGELGGLEPHVAIWDLSRGEVVRTIPAGADAWEVWSTFSPDGRLLVVMGQQTRPAEVWDLGSGKRLAALGRINNAAFSPDGSTLATTLEDSTVRLYDARSFDERLVLRGHDGGASWLDFSPDGTMLATGALDEVVRVWALDIDLLLKIARSEVTRTLTRSECRQFHVEGCS